MKFAMKDGVLAAAALVTLLLAPVAQADSGFYLGASVGETSVDIDAFDESDSSWKAYGGYIIDVPVVDFAVELAYLDFGSPSGNVMQVPAALDATGLGAFGLVGIDFGIFGLFAKAGVVSWDADLNFGGLRDKEDGTDPGYGVGARLTFSSIEVRAEYEIFEFEDADVELATLGLVWRF
jgi:hypothetical protein